MPVRKSWLPAAIAVGFVAVVILAFAIGGEPPDADSPASEIVEHYVDNKDSVIAGALLADLAALLLIFFANLLRRTLSVAGDPTLSATVLVGAAVMAVGIAIDATISMALAEEAENIEASSVQALQALWDNDFLPLALGTLVFLISAGISTLRTGAFPSWLGWIAVVLAIIGLTPIGWIAAIGGAVWMVIASLFMVRAARAPAAEAPAARP